MSSKTRCDNCSKKLTSGIIEGDHTYCRDCADKGEACPRCVSKTMLNNQCYKCYFTKRSLKCDICHQNMTNGKIVDGVFKCWFCADEINAKKSANELCKKCGRYALQKTFVKEHRNNRDGSHSVGMIHEKCHGCGHNDSQKF